MTSQQIKLNLGEHFLYVGGYLGVFTEVDRADLFCIRRTHFTVEVEIKVDRSDLVRELKAVQAIVSGDKITEDNYNLRKYGKYYKHEHYLKGTKNRERYHKRPNEFYFAVPVNLSALALAGVNDTPYGVIVIGEDATWASGIETQKRAKKIHFDKIGSDQMDRLLRKASTEVFNLRGKLNGNK